LDKWDLALSLALSEDDIEVNIPIGLSSKYYFPTTIKGERISPYLGGSIGYTYVSAYDSMSDTETSGWQADNSILAGVSWALGPGSLDVGVEYSKVSNFAVTVGYTFFPWRK
jgi:outer membrane protein W